MLKRLRVRRGHVVRGLALLIGLIILQAFLGTLETSTTTGEWQTPLPVLTLGVITGMGYGLLAVGLVLTYRHNRIINFAHGDVGGFATAATAIMVLNWHLPYWVAFLGALLAGGAVNAAIEATVIRRLSNAPRVMSIVGTLGAGTFVSLFAFSVNQSFSTLSYPRPPFLPNVSMGGLLITNAHFGLLILGPLSTAALALFLFRSRYGLAVRATAENPDAARLAGVVSGRMSSLVWALAGAMAAMTAVLTQPTRGFVGFLNLGPGLLLRALAAAAIAGMASLPLALIGGVAIGVVEQLFQWNYLAQGGSLSEVALFVVILLALLARRSVGGRQEEKGSWAAVQALRPIPYQLRQLRSIRLIGPVVATIAFGIALLIPAVTSNATASTMTGIFAVAIVGISLGVVTGLGGQLSLGQFAIAAIGGVVCYKVTTHGGNFLFGFVYAGLAGAAVSFLVGLPALRGRGLMLTVTTLAFAVVTPVWILAQPWMLGGTGGAGVGGGTGVNPTPPAPFGHSLDTGREYYYLSLLVLLVAFWLARNIRRTGFGNLLVAVRDNEDNARAFTIPATMIKMQGFVFAGFVAGLGGALYTHSLSRVTTSTFPASLSISLAVLLVIGGMGVLAGPLIGALYVIGFPSFVHLDSAGLAANSLGQLLLILLLPAGLAQVVEPLRDRVVAYLGRRAGIHVRTDSEVETSNAETNVEDVSTPARTVVGSAQARHIPKGTVLLEARHLTKAFGGVKAVSDVSFSVRAGETVGLIGPNGAGKTTTFELLGGFTRADAGEVWFDGENVTHLGPEARGRRGLIRSFQDAALFATLTVEETIALSFERTHRSRFVPAALGFSRLNRRRQAEAAEILASMGLERYRSRQIQELSTGTRRITEIACLIAMRPTLLLLDEPSSGIAQRETEALGRLLASLKERLDLTMVIIEHDIPLIMSLADRIVAMADGSIITTGTPTEVRQHPRVVESYLGASQAAIERSGGVVGLIDAEVEAR